MSSFDRPLTTWLFVTSIDPEQIQAAADARPDCVIVDMEDFTPPHLREQGRGALGETLSVIKAADVLPCVRINPTGAPDHDASETLGTNRTPTDARQPTLPTGKITYL